MNLCSALLVHHGTAWSSGGEDVVSKLPEAGKYRTTPVFVHTVVRPTPNYSHTFHTMSVHSAMLIHRGYISSAVDAFVCDTNFQSLLFTLPVIMRLFRPQSETPLMAA